MLLNDYVNWSSKQYDDVAETNHGISWSDNGDARIENELTWIYDGFTWIDYENKNAIMLPLKLICIDTIHQIYLIF
jgi:hypothetical protein